MGRASYSDPKQVEALNERYHLLNKIAEAIHPIIFARYKAVASSIAGGGTRFTKKYWLQAGGTERQIAGFYASLPSFDSKRAATRQQRRAIKRAEAKASRRSTYLTEYFYAESDRVGKVGKERAIAKNRKTQRQREAWAKRTGVWRLGKVLGLWGEKTHSIRDNTRGRGFDFDVIPLRASTPDFRVDAKSAFTTSKYQSRQVRIGWRLGIRSFLLDYNKYKECKRSTWKGANGDVWG